MRATNLDFRSPKEKTAEIGHPQVTFDGRVLPLVSKLPQVTFSKAKRFPQYEQRARITSPGVGPGSYDSGKERKISGTPAYYPLHGFKDTSDNGYFMLGNSLVYEPSFVIRKKVQVGVRGKSEDFGDLGLRSTSIRNSENTFISESKQSIDIRKKTAARRRSPREMLVSSPYMEHRRNLSGLKQ